MENVSSEVEKIELVLNETGENRAKIKKQAEKALAFLELKNERDSVNKGLAVYDLNKNREFLQKTNEKIISIIEGLSKKRKQSGADKNNSRERKSEKFNSKYS